MSSEDRQSRFRKTAVTAGFTLVEVIVAGSIMIILCVGILSVFSYVTKLNRGNNLRSQALTVLQREVEEFRGYRFVPGFTDPNLYAGDYPAYKTGASGEQSQDGTWFNIAVKVDNDPYDDPSNALNTITDDNCRFKEITITATMQNAQTGWLQDLKTTVTIQRVRSN